MVPQVVRKGGIKGPWYRNIVCEGNYRLLNSSRRYCNIFVGISNPFFMFLHQFYHFQAVMMSSGDLVSQRCAQLPS